MRAALLLFMVISFQSASAQVEVRELKSGKPRIYSAKTTYPHFRETTPLTRLANSKIVDWVKRDQADHILTDEEAAEIRKMDQEQAEENGGNGWSNTPWEYSVGCRVTIFRPRDLISVLCRVFVYSGGAHPMTSYQVFNFGTLAGQERVLTLSDFFREGASPPGGISKVILHKLKNPEGNSVEGIDLNDDELDKFVVEPDGLRFVFDQCELSCPAHELESKLAIQDLGPDFKKNLLKK